MKNEERVVDYWTLTAATRDAKVSFVNVCSAQLFSDFEVNKPLSAVLFFSHEGCRSDHKPKEMRFTVKPVKDIQIHNIV
jgi:hypothetical protein